MAPALHRLRYRRDGGGGWARGAQARPEEFAHPFDRLVQRQAALPGQILGGQRAVDPAGDGPRPGPQRDRRPIQITQRHRRGAGEMIASQPLAPADRFRADGVHPQAGIRARPVRARNPKSDVRNEGFIGQRHRQNDDGVDDRGPHNGPQLISTERPKLHEHATDIAFWLVTAAKYILPFAGRLKSTRQTGREVRNPGRVRERDLTSIKVDSPRRVAIDLQNPGGLLEGQALQNLGDLWPRWPI